MKVGDTNNDKKIREQELLSRTPTAVAREKGEGKKLGLVDGESKVNLGIGQEIAQQLNPTMIAAARKQRIEELKELVRSGRYQPPIMEVAARVAEELDAEILTMKGRIPSDDEL